MGLRIVVDDLAFCIASHFYIAHMIWSHRRLKSDVGRSFAAVPFSLSHCSAVWKRYAKSISEGDDVSNYGMPSLISGFVDARMTRHRFFCATPNKFLFIIVCTCAASVIVQSKTCEQRWRHSVV